MTVRADRLRTGSLRARTIVAVLALLVVLLAALAVTVDAALGARLRAQIQDRLLDRAAAAAALVGTVDADDLAERLSAQGLAVRIESAAGDEIVAGPSPDQLRAGPPAGLTGPDGAGPGGAGPDGDGPGPGGSARGSSSGDASAGGASAGDGSPGGAAPAVTVDSSVFSGDAALVTLTSTLSDGSTLSLTASAAAVDDTLVQLRWTMAAASVAFLLAAAVGVTLVVRRTLRPLDRVTTVARSIAGGDRGRRLRPSRPRTEIGRVASAFDEMLDDVEGAERAALDAELRMRAFVSDAAHELRTPVAGIRAAADTLVRAELAAGDRERLATHVAREAGRASRLIDDMLMMARLDRGLELDVRRIDLGSLVRAESDRMALRRPALALATRVPGDTVAVDGDADRIGQVVANLLDNAARFAGSGGSVTVELTTDAGTAVVAVTDDGRGVGADDRERIFERLVRLDPARDSSAGAGLGLPIARGIARSHGGDVRCLPTVAGARFEVTLPLVSGAAQRTNRTSVSVSPRNGSVCAAPSSSKPFRV